MMPTNIGWLPSSSPSTTNAKITLCDLTNIRLFDTTGAALGVIFDEAELYGTATQPSLTPRKPFPTTDAGTGAPRMHIGPALLKALKAFESLEALAEDWDSYGSEPPTPTAIASARDLLWKAVWEFSATARGYVVPVAIVPLSGGGVQMEWTKDEKNLEVEVGPRGEFGYLLVTGSGPSRQSREEDGVAEDHIMNLVQFVIS